MPIKLAIPQSKYNMNNPIYAYLSSDRCRKYKNIILIDEILSGLKQKEFLYSSMFRNLLKKQEISPDLKEIFFNFIYFLSVFTVKIEGL